jgi:hypothetical protein
MSNVRRIEGLLFSNKLLSDADLQAYLNYLILQFKGHQQVDSYITEAVSTGELNGEPMSANLKTNYQKMKTMLADMPAADPINVSEGDPMNVGGKRRRRSKTSKKSRKNKRKTRKH